MKNKFVLIFIILIGIIFSGCVGVSSKGIFGTGVSIAFDPRTVGTQMDDSIMQKNLAARILIEDKKYILAIKVNNGIAFVNNWLFIQEDKNEIILNALRDIDFSVIKNNDDEIKFYLFSIKNPIDRFYKGVTYKFFTSKIKKIINKDILINSLKEFDEIILIGSGKGVASVKTINQIKWKRKSLRFYNLFFKKFRSAINSCPKYK